GDLSGGVAMVADFLGFQDLIEFHFFTAGDYVALPPPSPFRGISYEEELADGVGKNYGSLIAALADHVATRRDLALELHQSLADDSTLSNRAGIDGDFLRANDAGHVL